MARSNKTKQVMRLVTGGKAPAKADTNKKSKESGKNTRKITRDFDTDKLTQSAPKNPALRITDEKAFEKRLVHIPTELLKEQLKYTVKRFNVCGCDICAAIITEMTISELPNRFVKVDTPKDEEELNRALNEMRPELLKILAKICIKAKTKPLHDGGGSE